MTGLTRSTAAAVAGLAALSLLAAGCYSYAPLERSAAAPGMNVRARISYPAAERVAPLIGTTTRELTGTIVDATNGTLIVEVPSTTQTGIGNTVQTLNQRLSLAPADIVELETRTLDRRKTAVVIGTVVAVTAAGIATALHGGDPGLDRPPTGGTTETRVPILRFRF